MLDAQKDSVVKSSLKEESTWIFASTATAFLDPYSAVFRPCADRFMMNGHLSHQNFARCALLQRIASANERAVRRTCYISIDCGNLGASNRVVRRRS